MIVMHVRDHDVANILCLDADRTQAFLDWFRNGSAALLGHRGAEARVDDDRAFAADDRPHVVIERHIRVLVRVGVEEVSVRLARDLGVFDRVYPIARITHH